MLRPTLACGITLGMMVASCGTALAQPLRVYTENPRYLERNGVPVVLFGSGEWCILSDTRVGIAEHNAWYAACRANANRASLFAFCVREGRDDLLAPWPRVGPGAARDGQPRFDLSQWDERFWERLHEYFSDCMERDIIVLLQIFDEPFTEGNRERWGLNPFNAENNLNEIPGMPGGSGSGEEAFYDPTNAELMAYQDALVLRLLDETAGRYNNVIYEIGNEINMDSIISRAAEWQEHWLRLFADYEAARPGVELILTNNTRESFMRLGRGRWGALNHHGMLIHGDFVRTPPAKLARQLADALDQHHREYGAPVLNSRPCSDPDRTNYPDIVTEEQGRVIYLSYLFGGGHVVGFRTTIESWRGGRAAERIIEATHTLVDALPLFGMEPRHDLVEGEGVLCLAGAGALAVFLPTGGSCKVDLAAAGLTGSVHMTRYDPRTMAFEALGEVMNSPLTLQAPTSGPGNDWVFILRARGSEE